MNVLKRKRLSQNSFAFEKLETRQLLSADFSFDGNLLDLDVTEANTHVIISQDSENYFFDLSTGTWNGVDENGAEGAGSNRLKVNQAVLDEAFEGLDLAGLTNQNSLVTFAGPSDFSTLNGLFKVTRVSQLGQTNSQIKIGRFDLRATSIGLIHPENQFTGISRITSANAVIRTGSDIRLDHIDVTYATIESAGDLTVNGFTVEATNLVLRSDANLNFTTVRKFEVATFSVEGNNVEVRAGASGYEGENPRIAHLNRLNFQSDGNVIISSSSVSGFASVSLIGENYARNLNLNLTSRVIGAPGSSLNIEQDARIFGVRNVWLGHYQDNLIRIGGQANLVASTWQDEFGVPFDGRLSIGDAGEVHFGSILLDGRSNHDGSSHYILIHEDSSTLIDGIDVEDVRSVKISSHGSIFDASHAKFLMDGALLALTSDQIIVLGEDPTNKLVVGGLRLSAANIYVGGRGLAQIGNLSFNSAGVTRIAEDGSMHLFGNNSANSAGLISTGSVLNAANATIVTQHGFDVRAARRIILANHASDQLAIGGRATFIADRVTNVGGNGTANFAQLEARSRHVFIREASDTHLVGNIRADHLQLRSAGYISDGNGISFRTTANAFFKTTKGLLFANSVADTYELCGRVRFEIDQYVIIRQPGRVTIGTFSVKLGTFRSIHIDARC